MMLTRQPSIAPSVTGKRVHAGAFRVIPANNVTRPSACASSRPAEHETIDILDRECSNSSRRQVLGQAAAAACLSLVSGWVPEAQAAATGMPGQGVDIEGKTTLISEADVERLTLSEKQVYSLNRRVQAQNRAPELFPGFIREGFDVKVVGDGYIMDSNGLIYKDFRVGSGPLPTEGQEVIFNYTAFNESSSVIDSSYRQGRPAQSRLGVGGLIPGFDLALRDMRVGTQRRVVVPPALGPPVGPSTFFSAKQCEVFDVEVLAIRTCTRRQMAMFSDVVCE
mmetsp:Transcript_5199/g.11337  ORF Transcript_5199/g.11337 Transcript_5199/m.11337 type:complete len:280 (+) Transcript_5199:134-973(+)|eukprot:CAMPEP_0202891110 /NCGR_PEP_ID=MMETSP1392-20130828/1271_1 /ASSEMBLY_ACC=CAM_ASM_000868 /TAXON_ID=225041 /ORGANISM="Chlamydomonas chlamydogama, Strain SAG 11-48b" /LENGTH=279 /DNA_ID=CAMNT_0049574787 /DNA_START=94 /DNA_END=933 /DNA_ORIENTATION=+